MRYDEATDYDTDYNTYYYYTDYATDYDAGYDTDYDSDDDVMTLIILRIDKRHRTKLEYCRVKHKGFEHRRV